REAQTAAARCVLSLPTAAKGNSFYAAIKWAESDVEALPDAPVPLHLRNAPTSLMKELGYGKGYEYAHGQADAVVDQSHFPDEIGARRYYHPSNRGYESRIRAFLEWLEEQKVERRKEGE
ncbi:hypothetical protein H8E52_04615, partial [bacterium]|nr:hypothetical protein [bacterium]